MDRGPDDWIDTPSEPRDWKKVVLIAGLGILSWVATYVGMLELIEANMGDLPLVHYTYGKCPETGKRIVAHGVIAVGRLAWGIIAIGQASLGVVVGF